MGLVLIGLSSIGKPSPVKFVSYSCSMYSLSCLTPLQWRYMLYLALLTMELAFILNSSPLSSDAILVSGSQKSIFHVIFPHRVSFQHILFLHQLFMFLSTALTQVAPVLFPGPPPTSDADSLLHRLNLIAGAADREASIILHTNLHSIQPFNPNSRTSVALMRPCEDPAPEVMQYVSEGFERLIIEKNIMQEGGPLRSVWENAINRGRKEKAQTYLNPSDADGRSEHGSFSLPSPISPRASPARDLPPHMDSLDAKVEMLAPGKLPSPRPSPPPNLQRQGSVRARCVSY
jgi:hypothetical protein